MSPEKYQLHQLEAGEAIPYPLLLLADETIEAINKYIFSSDIYTLYSKESADPIAVFALYKMSEKEVEIKNIAVLESLQGKGIGTILLEKINEIAAGANYSEIIVGTGDAGVKEIRFYEKNGFVKSGLIKNFYLENYQAPIFANGNVLRDMVMLRKPVV